MDRTDELKRAQEAIDQKRKELNLDSKPKTTMTPLRAMSMPAQAEPFNAQARLAEIRERNRLAEIERERKREERERELAARREELGVSCLYCCDTGDCDNADETVKRYWGWCDCEIGKAKKAEEDGRKRRAREQEFRTTLEPSLQIPKRFQGLTVETHPTQNATAIAQLRTWITEHDGQRGLFLSGPFGTGKTALILATLKSLVLQAAERADWEKFPSDYGTFTTATNLLESLRPQDAADRTLASNGQMLRRYRTVPYLALDDLGSERLTPWGADRLFEVVNHRHNELLPMLVTSNLNLKQLAERMNQQVGDGESGDRIVNRLLESCDVITLASGRNLRLRGAA